jgi:hypothetical protein
MAPNEPRVFATSLGIEEEGEAQGEDHSTPTISQALVKFPGEDETG